MDMKEWVEEKSGYTLERIDAAVVALRAKGFTNEAMAVALMEIERERLIHIIDLYSKTVDKVTKTVSTAKPRERILREIEGYGAELKKELHKVLG